MYYLYVYVRIAGKHRGKCVAVIGKLIVSAYPHYAKEQAIKEAQKDWPEDKYIYWED